MSAREINNDAPKTANSSLYHTINYKQHSEIDQGWFKKYFIGKNKLILKWMLF